MKVAVIGATGFTGEKLIDILLKHPKVTISYISAKVQKPFYFASLFPHFKGKIDLVCDNLNLKKALAAADIVFLALPHRVSFLYAPYFLKGGKRVIDLSADYRFKNSSVYKHYYGTEHRDKKNLKEAVYGLPEFFASNIEGAQLIANPGCYPTASILSLAPLLKEGILNKEDIVIDAKSGITGAGRHASLDYHYAHLAQNVRAYKVFEHQHLPEMNHILGEISKKKISVHFSPHLLPIERGILITAYGTLKRKFSHSALISLYKKHYKGAYFVRVFDDLPQLKNTLETNYCDIGIAVKEKKIVIVGCIDNLIKGASGQAVQNMNIMCGWKQTLGLV
ncbi:MAG: N-acetyl-gamma-glutamyl-phosphate reductase [Candidatus Omnitrophota bacterium]|nr:MAG: N-acetyl-gamma-glutamyl-phosphate reductase [Candidatus Omnitrophota bacterium]